MTVGARATATVTTLGAAKYDAPLVVHKDHPKLGGSGCQDYLPLGLYYSDPGAKFNSSQVRGAMEARIGTVLLFPVFDRLDGNGANAQYNIIGWAGFELADFDAQGNDATIDGHFVSITLEGLESSSPGSDLYFGVKGLFLVE